MRTFLTLIAAIVVPELVGAIGGFATSTSVGSWYTGIEKPSFNPPSWVFGPVWITLYAVMGVASWLVWRQGGWGNDAVRRALLLYGVHLVFNLAWSLLFFGLQRPGLALVEIVVLLGMVLWTTLAFRAVSGTAAALMLPYLIWVAFATVLNGSIWWLNRG